MINVEKILQLDYLEGLLLQVEEHIVSEKEKIIKHYDIDILESMAIDEINNLFKNYNIKCESLLHLKNDVYLDESFEYAKFYMDDIAYSSEQKQLLREKAKGEIELLNSRIDLVNEQIFNQIMEVVKKTKLINLLIKVLKNDDLILGTDVNEMKKLMLTSSLLKDEDRCQASLSLVKYLIQSGRKILFNKENIDSTSFEKALDNVHKSSGYIEEKTDMNTKLPYYDVVLKYYGRYKDLFASTGYTDIFEFMLVADSLSDGIDMKFESLNRENFCIQVASLLYQLNFIDDRAMEKEILDVLLKLDLLYEMDMKYFDYKKQRLLDIDKCFSELDSLDLNVKIPFVLDIVNKIKNRLILLKMDLENEIISDIKKDNIDLEYQNILNGIDNISERINLINEIDVYNSKIRDIFGDGKNTMLLTEEISNLLVFIQDKMLTFKKEICKNDLTKEISLEIKEYFNRINEIELGFKTSVELPKENSKKVVLNGFVLCDFDKDNKPYILSDLDLASKDKMIDKSIETNKLKKGFDSYSKLVNELFLLGNTEKLDNNDSQGYNIDRLNEPVYRDPKNRIHENETGMYRLKYDRNGVESFIEQRIVLHHDTKIYKQVVEIIKGILPNVEFENSKDLNLYINFASLMKLTDVDGYSDAMRRYDRCSPLYKLFIGDRDKEQLTDSECQLLKDIINMSLNAFLELEKVNPNLHFDIIRQMGGVKTRG